MRKLILLMMIFSLSAYGQRVKENIKQQTVQGSKKETKVAKQAKPTPSKSHRGR